MTKALLPLLALTMMACGGTPDTPSDSGSASGDGSSSVFSGDEYTLMNALSWFGETGTYNRTFNFFDGTAPGATSMFLEEGCITNYRNFPNIDKPNQGYININSELAAKKGVEAGVYTWTREKDEDKKNYLALGTKVGTTTYKDLIYTPADIYSDASSYETALEPEIAGQKNGYYFLNKEKSNVELLTSFAKSLGVYDTIIDAGLTLNYAKIYFGATTKSITIDIYSKLGDGYDAYNTKIVCSAFGEANIAELKAYIEG